MTQSEPDLTKHPSIRDLNDRSREIFRAIVDAYVETGAPVGSRTLSRKLGMGLHPSVRHLGIDFASGNRRAGKPVLRTRFQKAAAKKAAEGTVMSDDERRKLVSTEQSLDMPAEPKIPSAIEGLEAFSLNDPTDDSEDTGDDNEYLDADSFFNLPGDDGDEQPDV